MDWTRLSAAALEGIESRFGNYPALALVGWIAAALALLWFAVLVLRLMMRLGQRFSDSSAARQLRKDEAPGYRILMAGAAGLGNGRLGKWAHRAANDHLATFNFGAPFKLARCSPMPGGTDGRSMRRARKLMTLGDADMIVWPIAESRDETGLVLHGLSRAGGLTAEEARGFRLELPGRYKALSGRMPQIAAYLMAKALQPQIGDPQAFRPEKMKLLANEIAAMLGEGTELPAKLKAGLEADYCAACVHLAEAMGDFEAIDQVIALRESHLAKLGPGGDPILAAQAHMDIGRALIARAEKQFDQKTVHTAIQHLSSVVEALRADPTIQRAQMASDVMFKAQTMIETRKRFSVNFGS